MPGSIYPFAFGTPYSIREHKGAEVMHLMMDRLMMALHLNGAIIWEHR